MILIQDGLDYTDFLLEHKTSKLSEYMKSNHISDAEVYAAIQDFIDAIEEEIKNESPTLLKENRFSRNRMCVQNVIYANIAAMFIAASIKGKKDVLARADVVEINGEEFHKKLTGLSANFKLSKPSLFTVAKSKIVNFYNKAVSWIKLQILTWFSRMFW